MRKFNILGVHRKIQVLGGLVLEKSIYRGGLPKKEGLGQFADLRRALAKKGVVLFFGGWIDTPTHTMNAQNV